MTDEELSEYPHAFMCFWCLRDDLKGVDLGPIWEGDARNANGDIRHHCLCSSCECSRYLARQGRTAP